MSWQSETDAGKDALEKMSKISEIAMSVSKASVSTVTEDFNHPHIAKRDREEKRRDREKFSQLAKEPLTAAILTEIEEGDKGCNISWLCCKQQDALRNHGHA